MDDDHAELLTELGLSSYEAKAYVVLAQYGSMTADDVAEESEVPRGRVYDVLNSLVDRELARADDGRPRTYVYVEPDEAVEQLLDKRIDELETQRSAYEQTAATAADALAAITNGEQSDGFATSAVHEDAARKLLLERFAATDETIRIAANTVDMSPEFKTEFANRLRELLDVGVSVRLLGVDFDHAADRISSLVDAGMAVRKTDHVPHQRFIILDDDEVCLEVVNPMSGEELLAVVNFRDDETARTLGENFDELWEQGTPWSLEE